MNALISPNEQVISYDGTVLGARVVEVSVTPFEVAPPLYWVGCADDVVADRFYCVGTAILPIPEPPQPEPVPVVEQQGPTVVAD